MNKTIAALAIAALAFAGGAHAADSKTSEKGEAELAKLLEGRTAGKPQSCIPAQISTRLRVIDQTAMVYESGKTVYVARAEDPRSLDTNDILVIKRFGSELCKQDIIHTVDRTSGFLTGVVFLNDFVPYEKK
jgi:hypothetical protein